MKTLKKANPQIKRNLANGFGSFISNQRAIDCAKEFPFWLAIIFFVISVFVPVIPTLVSSTQSYGSSFMASTTYGMDTALYSVTNKLKVEGYSFNVMGSDLILKDNSKAVISELIGDDNDNKFDYIDALTGQYLLRFVYTDKTGTELNNLYNSYYSETYLQGTTTKQAKEDDETAKLYTPSILLVTKTTLSLTIFKLNTTGKATASSYGGATWNNTAPGDLLVRLTTTSSTTISGKIEDCYKAWCSVFDETYLEAKVIATRNTTLIYLGIYAILIIFMGLLVFLLTRGKRNVFHFLSFWTCEKIAIYAAPAPAILALILGFIIPSFGQMSFILLFGVRVMWLSMKQLRPVEQ